MTAVGVSMKLAAAENQDRNTSIGGRNGIDNSSTTSGTNRRVTRPRTETTATITTVTPCQRCHRHSPSISSTSSSSEVVPAPSRSHRRRFSMQISPVPPASSSASMSSASDNSHGCRQYRPWENTQSNAQVLQGQTSRHGRGHSHHHHVNASGSSSSFLRRIIKVFVGTNNGSELYDGRHNRVHPLHAPMASRSLVSSSSSPRSPDANRHAREMEELQTDESGSCEECECSCEDPHIDNTKVPNFRSCNTNRMMSHALPPPPCPSQPTSEPSRGHKKRSNSTVTTSSIASSSGGTGGRHIRSSRPGRTSSVGGVSINSCYTDSSESSSGVGCSDFTNRRSSFVSSTGGSSSGSNSGTGDKTVAHPTSQIYRHHFTGHGLFTPPYAAQQEAMMKRRLSFFKAVAMNGGGSGAGSASRRGSAFSTKSQETAVNLTGINIADEPEDEVDSEDDNDSESFDDGQDHDMDVDENEDEDGAFNDNYVNDPNDFMNPIYDREFDHDEDTGAIEQDYYGHDNNSSMMLTSDVELELYRPTRHLKTNDSVEPVVYRTRSKTGRQCLQPPLGNFEQRPSPIQLPEILHLIFQFVVDFTPADDFSQREIYSCLLVSKQWYLVAQKTLWREIRLKNPAKLEMLIDLLKRTDTVECLGIERNMKQSQQAYLPPTSVASMITKDQQSKQGRPSTHRQQEGAVEMSTTTAIENYLHVLGEDSIMSPTAMQRRLHERAHAVKKIVLHKLKLIEDCDILPLTSWFHNLQIIEFYICEKLTDKIILSVAENCPQLQQLLVPGCSKITDVGISQIALHCPRMRHLDLRACSNISDESLILVARHCHDLWHLNVGRVTAAGRVTGKSIAEIAKNTNLNTLGLAGCAMTDDAVIEIARSTRSGLHRISLNSCPMLTSASIRALMQLCPNLAVLEIKQCLLVTDMATLYRFSTKRVLVELCPELQKRLIDYKVELAAMNVSIQSHNLAATTHVAGASHPATGPAVAAPAHMAGNANANALGASIPQPVPTTVTPHAHPPH
ncbi:Antagonist of MEN (Mitotic Exit Network) [Mortierella alpina]|nr:Antagonist of MEN (Mitotic Exit Network) [Mortierella alpina]